MNSALRVMARLDELAACSDEPGALTRLYLTPAHAAAAAKVRAWMEEAGLAVRLDPAASLVGRVEGRRPGLPALVLGSHIDTVRDAGRYDGTLGVVTAMEAVQALREEAPALPFALEVVAFGDEEGVRFPVTLTGSRALAGTLPPGHTDARDVDGVSLAQALARFGCDPSALPSCARRPDEVLAYLEVHIEQGPVLQARDLPLGIVTAIAGAVRCRIEVAGSAGHAGTLPMTMRRDALAAAAEMVLAIERLGSAGQDTVATVGSLVVRPDAVNTVPGHVAFSLDARSPDDAALERLAAAIEATCREIAGARGVGLSWTRTHAAPAARCAPALQGMLAKALERLGLPPFSLPSGAGHDAMVLGGLAPMAMLFVRCKDGLSHHPAESIRPGDAGRAVEALIQFILLMRDHHG